MKITRILSMLMIIVMLATALIACGDKENVNDPAGSDNGNVTTAGGENGETTPEGGGEQEGDVLFDVAAVKGMAEGNDVNILSWSSEHREFEVDKSELVGSEPLLEGIYARNVQVMDALGVNLIYTEVQDGSSYAADVLKYVEMQADGGISFDIIALYSRTAGLVSQKGHLLPVNYFSDYINLNNSWYPDALVEESNIRGNIYYVSGDISTNLLYLTYGFIFNKDVLGSLSDYPYDETKLYQLVADGKWTLDEMFALTGDYYVDADSSGSKSKDDGVGLRSYNYHFDAFYVGSNMKYVQIDNSTTDPDSLVKISTDYTSQKAVDLADRFGDFLQTDYAYNDDAAAKTFANNDRDLSIVTRVRDIQKIHDSENNDMKYGVLPIPKYDVLQPDYKCVAGNPFTLWGISADVCDYDREIIAAAVIEYSGYIAQGETTEAIFETLFKGRYADYPEDADSFDIIKRTTSFDIGRVFTRVLHPSLAIADQWSSAAAKSQKWSTKMVAMSRSFEAGALTASRDFWELRDTLLPTPK